MCMQTSAIRSYQQWRWGGDEIVHNPVIPAARRAAGSRKHGYDIDIREYLSIKNNAVVYNWLHTAIKTLPIDEQLRFYRTESGNFDFRADFIARSMNSLRYKPSNRHFDQWLFPDETLSLGGGDCEDLAFVLASLLAAAGISPSCIRVALGKITDHTEPDAVKSWDHTWVMYQMENGAWQILEPMAKVHRPASVQSTTHKRSTIKLQDVEYLPHFVFNTEHLWRVRTPELRANDPFISYLESREEQYWGDFNPSFAAGVHFDIYDHALEGMNVVDRAIVKAVSLGVDANVLSYDPRDHFDFAYIPEGWQQVQARLATGSLKDFGLATHAIADFYAHSLYGYFATPNKDQTFPLYDPIKGLPAEKLKYDFLKNEPRPGSNDDANVFLQRWNGKLISGQWWRWYTTYPNALRGELPAHRCLPDHDRLAVDGANLDQGTGHAIYPNQTDYHKQFILRQNTAINHIRMVYREWGKGGH